MMLQKKRQSTMKTALVKNEQMIFLKQSWMKPLRRNNVKKTIPLLITFILIYICIDSVFAETEDEERFYRVIVLMIADFYKEEIAISEVTFSNPIENRNLWSAILRIKENEEITIIVENIHLSVTLIDEKGTVLLFRGTKSPAPWDKGRTDKRWVYEYLLKK